MNAIRSFKSQNIKETFTFSEVADILKLCYGIKTGRNRLLKLMRDNVIFSCNNMPVRKYIEEKYFEVFPGKEKNGFRFQVPVVTLKGINLIYSVLRK